MKVLTLSTCAIVCILLTTRLDDIAHFAVLGADFLLTLSFTLNQVPFILPIALPIACLISSILLMQRLSTSYELTALRSCGLSIIKIFTPILLISIYLSLMTFFIVSEVSTHAQMQNSSVKEGLRSVNPLLLLRNKHLMQMKGIYFDTLGPSRIGETADDVIIALPNEKNDGLHLLIAKHLSATGDLFSGEHVTLFSQIGHDHQESLLENVGSTELSSSEFKQLFSSKNSKIKFDHLDMRLLRQRIEQADDPKVRFHGYAEVSRRLSVALAVFTFAFMGCAFGMSISRRKGYGRVLAVVLLSSIYLTLYFIAKGVQHQFLLASALYFVPQICMICFSCWMTRQISRGNETWV